jgi:hypothetical protein
VALLGVMLLDNSAWFARYGAEILQHSYTRAFEPGLYMSRGTWKVLKQLNDARFAGGFVVAQSRPLSYYAIVYTPLRAWYSQEWNTPHPKERLAQLDDLFNHGTDLDEWRHRKMIAVVNKPDTAGVDDRLLMLGYQTAYGNAEFDVLVRAPIEPATAFLVRRRME